MPNIPVSSLYVIMGVTNFGNFHKVIANIWNTYDKADFKKWEIIATKNGDISKTKSSKEQLEHIQKKLKIDVNQYLVDCHKTNCKNELVNKQANIIKTLTRGISTEASNKEEIEKMKNDITRLVKDNTNTTFGNKHENSAISKFEKETKIKVINQQKRFNNLIDTNNGIEWRIVGVVDGFTETGEIVEIKNRVSNISKNPILRNYEKPQIMTYMWLSNSKNGYLVENYKVKGNDEIRIIPVQYQEDYFEKDVVPAISKFIKFFNMFIKSDSMKELVIRGEDKLIYNEYIEFIQFKAI